MDHRGICRRRGLDPGSGHGGLGRRGTWTTASQDSSAIEGFIFKHLQLASKRKKSANELIQVE